MVNLIGVEVVDIRFASEWFEDQREDLGVEFIESVDECVKRVGDNPFAFRVVFGDNRRANLERFPYALFSKFMTMLWLLAVCMPPVTWIDWRVTASLAWHFKLFKGRCAVCRQRKVKYSLAEDSHDYYAHFDQMIDELLFNTARTVVGL